MNYCAVQASSTLSEEGSEEVEVFLINGKKVTSTVAMSQRTDQVLEVGHRC